MILSIFSDFLNYLNDKFSGSIPNLIFFAIGLGIGIILFLLIILIIALLSRPKKKIKQKIIEKNIVIKDEYKGVVQSNKDVFIHVYKSLPIKEKMTGMGKIILDMMNSIAALYFPTSKDPMFEISLERLVDFLSYATARINFIIDNLLEERFHFVNALTNYSLKDKKISFIFEMIEKNKKPENLEEKKVQKTNLFTKMKGKIFKASKKMASKIGGNIINNEFEEIIDAIGEDINRLYSGQDLTFNDLTKKELKKISKEQKKALSKNKHKEMVGDLDE